MGVVGHWRDYLRPGEDAFFAPGAAAAVFV